MKYILLSATILAFLFTACKQDNNEQTTTSKDTVTTTVTTEPPVAPPATTEVREGEVPKGDTTTAKTKVVDVPNPKQEAPKPKDEKPKPKEEKPKVTPPAPKTKDNDKDERNTVAAIFKKNKNVEISRCLKDGKKYIQAQMNVFDGGTKIYDMTGKEVVVCTPMLHNNALCQMDKCEVLYTPIYNIWKHKPVDVLSIAD